MSASVRPYLVASAESVMFDGWEIEANDGAWEPLEGVVPEWDYNTQLRLRAVVAPDSDVIRSDAGLPADAPIRLTVSWRSTDGRIGYTAVSIPIEEMTGGPVHVTLPGDRLGPAVDLALRLVLAADLPASDVGVAHLSGSVLWENVTNVLLVGESERFPVMVIDFGASGLDPDASWTLDLPSDLAGPVQGGVVLLINSRDTDLVAAASGRRTSSGRLIDELHEQVAVQLLDHAVTSSDELESGTWAPGSFGATLLLLARRSEDGLEGLVAMKQHAPAAYRATLVGEARRNGVGRSLS